MPLRGIAAAVESNPIISALPRAQKGRRNTGRSGAQRNPLRTIAAKWDASERHYLNNPTLSDNGAQCGGLGVIAYKGVSETRYLADTPVVASLRDADDMLHS